MQVTRRPGVGVRVGGWWYRPFRRWRKVVFGFLDVRSLALPGLASMLPCPDRKGFEQPRHRRFFSVENRIRWNPMVDGWPSRAACPVMNIAHLVGPDEDFLPSTIPLAWVQAHDGFAEGFGPQRAEGLPSNCSPRCSAILMASSNSLDR